MSGVSVSVAVEGAAEAARDVRKVSDAVKDVGASTAPAAAGADNFARSLKGVALPLIGAKLIADTVGWLKQFAAAAFDASATAQKLAASLNFTTGGNAARELAFLRDTTDRLSLNFDASAKSFSGFAASARGTSLEGQGVRDVFEGVATAAAALSLNAKDVNDVFTIFSHMLGNGVVNGRELRVQLEDRLPGAFRAAARAMGVTDAELGKMIERGDLVATDLIPKLGRALKEDFAGAARDAGSRLDAASTSLDNAAARLRQTMGDAGISQTMADGMRKTSNTFNLLAERMEIAKAQGDGLAMQWASAAGLLSAYALGLNYVTDNYSSLATRIGNAEKKYTDLQAAVAKETDINLRAYLRQALTEAKDAVDKLKALKAAIDGSSAAGPGDNEDRNDRAARAARALEERRSASKKMIDDVRGLAQTDTDIRQQWVDNVQRLSTAYAKAIEVESEAKNPAGVEALQREMVAKVAAAQDDGAKKLRELANKRSAEGRAYSAAVIAHEAQQYENQFALNSEGLQRINDINERMHNDGLRELSAYLTEKKRITLAEIDAEAALLQRHMADEAKRKATLPIGDAAAAKSSDTKILALQGQLDVLRAKRRDVAADSVQDDGRMLESAREKAQQWADAWTSANDAVRAMRDATADKAIGLIADPMAKMKAESERAAELVRRGAAEKALAVEVKLTAAPSEEARQSLLAQIKDINDSANALIAAGALELADRMKPGWQRMLESWRDTSRLMKESFDAAMEGTLKAGEDAFVQFAQTGKLNIKGLVDTIIAEFARAQFRKMAAGLLDFIGPLLGLSGAGAGSSVSGPGLKIAPGTWPSARGNVFGAQRFAAGGVVTGPQLFRFASGGALRTGLMGEAGPEAVMPLRRGPDGKLGVAAAGSAATYNINVSGDATTQTVRMIESALARYDRQRRQTDRR